MNIVIASGKGGTGKTTFALNLAYALAAENKNVRLLDCDVEQPNDHLFINPAFSRTEPVTARKPVVNNSKCTGCGKCAEACMYNALAVVRQQCLLFNELCHACGVCSYVCPENAIAEEQKEIGEVSIATSGAPFFFAHGILNIGESMAPKVVSGVKRYADRSAVNILDSAPGTGCQVVKTLENADAALLVTEPTPFGLHDLHLAASLSLQMRIPTCVVINRSEGDDSIIYDYARSAGIPVAGQIPFKREYAETYSKGGILINEHPETRELILKIFDSINDLLQQEVPPVPAVESRKLSGNNATFPEGSSSKQKEITVISGKGGTGKTTVTASFAQLADHKVLVDNDVDASDLHLLLNPETKNKFEFMGGYEASIEQQKCTLCGACMNACYFGAVRRTENDDKPLRNRYEISALACEGCGLCKQVCPSEAVSLSPSRSGEWYISEVSEEPMIHAALDIAEENSGKLVNLVRSEAAELAQDLGRGFILGDGAPGTGCPVIASITGVDLAVIVTEPTVSGVHDMIRTFKLTAHFGVPTVVIINKADLNKEQTELIKKTAAEYRSQVIGEIPFDEKVNEALMAGKTVIEYDTGPAQEAIIAAWHQIHKRLEL